MIKPLFLGVAVFFIIEKRKFIKCLQLFHKIFIIKFWSLIREPCQSNSNAR